MKKLRRKEISSHEHANVYLERDYLPEHNRRFARAAASPEDYHRRAPRAAELDRVFRLESERTISEDWVVRYDNRFFQLEPQSRHYAPAQGKVLVCEGRYGNIAIEYRLPNTAATLGSLEDLFHARAVVDALLGRALTASEKAIQP